MKIPYLKKASSVSIVVSKYALKNPTIISTVVQKNVKIGYFRPALVQLFRPPALTKASGIPFSLKKEPPTGRGAAKLQSQTFSNTHANKTRSF